MVASALAVGACGGGRPLTASSSQQPELGLLDQTHWTWRHAVCDDGTHDLDARGFEDHLQVTAVGRGLRMTHDIAFAADGCAETVVRWASADGSAFRLVDQARVADAVDRACSTSWPLELTGEIHARGAELELRIHRSIVCGGYDVRHIYSRSDQPASDEHAVVRHIVTGLVLRDSESVVRDFATQASLVVPRPASEGGGNTRYDGRAAARGWFTAMLRSVPWIGARIVELTETAPGRITARVEYMDGILDRPLVLMLTVAVADGEVYEVQLVFASEIAPRVQPDAGSPLPDAALLPDTGAQ